MRRTDWLDIVLFVAFAIPIGLAAILFFFGGWIATLLGFGPPLD